MKSISLGPMPALARARRDTSMPACLAISVKRSFWVSKSPGWKTSSMGTTLARAFTPAEAYTDRSREAPGDASSSSQARTQPVTSSCSYRKGATNRSREIRVAIGRRRGPGRF